MLKYSPRFLFLLLSSLLLIDNSVVLGSILKCSYNQGNYNEALNIYYCYVQNNGIFGESRVRIDAVEGQHFAGKMNNDVEGFIAESITIKYFPENLENIFKNLIFIGCHICHMKEISQSDLRKFPKLKHLQIRYGSQITTLEQDLFKFNPELTSIRMSGNQISHIHPNVFDCLKNLNSLQLSGNKCKSTFNDVSSRSDVLNIIKRINNGECASISAEAKNCDQENVTVIQANEDNSAKYEDLKANNTKLTSENQELRNKNEELENKLTEYEKLPTCDEMTKKNQILLEKLDLLRDKYESLLQNKLLESEKIIERQNEQMRILNGKNQGENIESEGEQTKNDNNECLTLFYAPNQRPIILTN